jgi:hypothetical protein
MSVIAHDEWDVVTSVLPDGWEDQAWELRAFRRVRYTATPAELLRILLFHAVNSGGMRETVTLAEEAGLGGMSAVALFKRLRTAGPWLRWIAAGLCAGLRSEFRLKHGLRPRAIDSTTIQGPASKGTGWMLHYTLDLATLGCDWHELTDSRGAEALERAPIDRGDVLIADRNYLRLPGLRAVVAVGGHVIARLRWCHVAMKGRKGLPFHALAHARKLRVGHAGDWPVTVVDRDGSGIPGRVLALKLPAPLAHRAQRRLAKSQNRQGHAIDPRSLEAARFVMLFTTLPTAALDTKGVLDLYRFRWQIELAFKRHKQLLRLGRLPHKDPLAAQSWILSKLIVALLLERLYRNAVSFSPWGYEFQPARRHAA